eukprot:scaffold365543_cov24-Prasinocladus_malaysianus.AAC.1
MLAAIAAERMICRVFGPGLSILMFPSRIQAAGRSHLLLFRGLAWTERPSDASHSASFTRASRMMKK